MPEKKKELKFDRPEDQLVFECAVCKKLYKNPGMCQTCELVLKKKGG